MRENLISWISEQGAPAAVADAIGWVAVALALIILAWLANYIAKKILLAIVTFFIHKTKTTWDDVLLKRRVFPRLSHLAPAMVFYFGAGLLGRAEPVIERLAMAYMMLAGLLVFNAFLNAVDDIYRTYEVSRQKPIKGYLQVVQIVVFILIGIVAIALLVGQNPLLLLSGLGAMTAVLILVFKDSILGLIAGIQLSVNDMVRIGDWIEMPKYGADGDVIDVSLQTVKVQNWNKTVSTIPAYALVSDSFKNWRGMSESGGRRIKRAIHIDMQSVLFCTSEMLDRFERYQYLSEYIKTKRKEVAEFNEKHGVDTSQPVNGRNLTNIGTFRAYLVEYLKHHPKIHKDMTFLVRHLPPGEHGLPIEIYVFSNDQAWANYEAIQADIFDHILAVVPMFDLRVFQRPSGGDMRALVTDKGTSFE